MLRHPILDSGVLCHIMARGIGRVDAFRDDENRHVFLKTFGELIVILDASQASDFCATS